MAGVAEHPPVPDRHTRLVGTAGLSDCQFRGPCTIDHRTIQRSDRLPLPFLRGCGLPDALIDYLPWYRAGARSTRRIFVDIGSTPARQTKSMGLGVFRSCGLLPDAP